MEPKKTHREVKKPKISARYLADFMAASATAQRTIVQKCKYQPIAKVVQHDEAKLSASKFFQSGGADFEQLRDDARRLRGRLASDDFERDVLDHNADYIDRLADVAAQIVIPECERLPIGQSPAILLHGVSVAPQLQFRLRRLTKTNKIRVGGGMFRYAKGKPLSPDVADWQSAFLIGYLKETGEQDAEPENQLCLTIDTYSGIAYPAPGDAVRRFKNMKAACETIAERWPAIKPPPNAVL
ncbi:MAG: hypothetical protein JSR89_09180 [Proteobacteria bacterium]|nr:hypothetical protein [Pseudomonadota bacterium]